MLRTIFGLVFWLTVYLGLGAAVYFFWYLPKYAQSVETVAPERVRNVRATTVAAQDYEISRTFRGSIQSSQTLRLNFRTAGCVSKVHTDLAPNTIIPQGTLIASLDDTLAKLNKAEAERKVNWHDTRIREAEIELATRQNALARAQTALKTLKEQLARQRALYERNLSTIVVLEEAETRLRIGHDAASEAEDAVALTRANLDRLIAERQIHDVQLDQIKTGLADYQLRAPKTLRVINGDTNVGDCVSIDSTVLEGFELDSLQVHASLPRLLYQQLIKHAPLLGQRVAIDTLGQDCDAVIENVAFGKTNADVSLHLSLPKKCQDGFLLNAPVTFALMTDQLQQVYRLPIAAEHGQDQIFVVNQGTLEKRRVEVSLRDAKWLYVSRGLAAGETVLVSGADFAVEGLKVRVVMP